jgi:uncharacterized protein
MIFFDEIQKELALKSILCWLATVDREGLPNVSPKEMWTYYEGKILIANIASPNSVQNIRINPKVCLSFLEVFVQKGFKVKGVAAIIESSSEVFNQYTSILQNLYGTRIPFSQIIEIEIKQVKSIVAPSYIMFSETTTEEGQIKSAYEAYQAIALKYDF